jgi:hypothetical protein
MSCVNCYYDLCDVLVCDNEADIILPTLAPLSGTYTLVLEFLGTAKAIQADFSQNEPLVFSGCQLNENYCYEGYVLNPVGEVVIVDSANSSYTGIKFCTKQKFVC